MGEEEKLIESIKEIIFKDCDLEKAKTKVVKDLLWYEMKLNEAINIIVNRSKVIDTIIDAIVGDKKILALVCKKIINKTEEECDKQNLLCDDCIKEYFYNKAQEN